MGLTFTQWQEGNGGDGMCCDSPIRKFVLSSSAEANETPATAIILPWPFGDLVVRQAWKSLALNVGQLRWPRTCDLYPMLTSWRQSEARVLHNPGDGSLEGLQDDNLAFFQTCHFDSAANFLRSCQADILLHPNGEDRGSKNYILCS